MKRPLFLIFVGLVLGEAAAMKAGVTGYLAMALFLLLFHVLFMGRPDQSRFFTLIFPGEEDRVIKESENRAVVITGLLFLSLLAGGLRQTLQDYLTESDPGLMLVREGRSRQVEVLGEIDRIVKEEEGDYQILLKKRSCLMTGRSKVFARYKIKVFCKSSKKLLPGDLLRLKGNFGQTDLPTNPGQFNQRRYEYASGIHYHLDAGSPELLARGGPGLTLAAWKVRTRIERVFAGELPAREAGLLDAMLLGDKTGLSREDRRMYEESGSSHLLAVSGLHCSLISGRVYAFLRKRKLSYVTSCMLGAFFLIFYACMTGAGSSVIRASIMYICYLVSELSGMDYDLPSAMSLSGIIMLFERPERLTEGGWIISFASVTAIGFFVPAVRESLKKERERGLSPGEISGGDTIMAKFRDMILDGVLLSMFTAPVVAFIYYEWCPLSILLNIVLIPAMGPLLLGAMSGGILGIMAPILGRPSCIFCFIILKLFGGLFFLAGRLPWSLIVTGHFSPGLLALVYGAEGLLFFLWRRKKYWYAFSFLCLLLSFSILAKDSSIRVHMLDVGQGDCILVCFPGGKSMLIDGGSTSRQKVGSQVIGPALKYYGIYAPDYVVLTHMDEDHISGIRELMEEDFQPGTLVLPALSQEDEAYESMENAAHKAGCPILRIGRGDKIRISDVSISCLNPARGALYEDRNDGSVTLCIRSGGFDALFTGDIGSVAEMDILAWLKDNPEESAFLSDGLTLLKVAHHGSESSSAQELIDYIRPRYAIISCGKNNRYGHPSARIIERLTRAGAKIARTDRGGAITVGPSGLARWQDN